MLCASPDDLFAYLDSLGIAHRTVTHAPVFTVEESRGLMSRVPGVHSKKLFLRDKKGTLFLIVASEDAAIELKSLHRVLGASGRFSFGSADLLRETLGVEPGSVTPVRGDQRQGRPSNGRARCRDDGARGAELSPAVEHRNDDDLA
jgi:Ala-tRNA(Pro) deacylase